MYKKKIKLFLAVFVLIYNVTGFSLEDQQDYRITRKIAQTIFADYPETLYCACQYSPQGQIYAKSCSLIPTNYNKRATNMEFEHMMPMENAGRHLSCWRDKICMSKSGKQYRGRACCRKISPEFRQMESELLNLWPSVGSLNQARSNFRFTEFSAKEKAVLGKFDNCELWIDKKARKVEPRDAAKGIVARANLFMARKYSIQLSSQQKKLFIAWHKKYPPTSWEITWNNRIIKIQGYGNDLIKRED